MGEGFQIIGLAKSYRGFALQAVSLSIPPGECVGLVGPNGAGKTTLIKCILGLVRRDSGRVLCDGKELDPNDPSIRRMIGYVPEEAIFYERMTVGRALEFYRSFYPTWDDKFCAELLRLFRLEPNKRVHDLSHGMRVKLSLLLAMAYRPKVYLLDEPTSGLDPRAP